MWTAASGLTPSTTGLANVDVEWFNSTHHCSESYEKPLREVVAGGTQLGWTQSGKVSQVYPWRRAGGLQMSGLSRSTAGRDGGLRTSGLTPSTTGRDGGLRMSGVTLLRIPSRNCRLRRATVPHILTKEEPSATGDF